MSKLLLSCTGIVLRPEDPIDEPIKWVKASRAWWFRALGFRAEFSYLGFGSCIVMNVSLRR